MKHTPGPWECVYKRKYDEWYISLPDDGSTMRIGFPVKTNNPEGDAKLIAAAPELTRLCSDLLNPENDVEPIRYELKRILRRVYGEREESKK